MAYLFELIVAVNQDGIIGINNTIPWHIPEDLQRFKRMTEGHIVIMGRKTYESLPPKNRPLKNRFNIVLTTSPELYFINEENDEKKNVCFTRMENLSNVIKENLVGGVAKKIFIIGGSEIYHLFIDYCSIIHMTRVYFKVDLNDDATISFFPFTKLYKSFVLEEEKEKEETLNLQFNYLTYIKKNV
jgi:dihydrofolate reductase